MRISLTAIIRSLAFLVVGATMLALGLSKVVPAVTPEQSREASPRYIGVNSASFVPHHIQNYLLDTETGEMAEFALPGPGQSSMDFVTCSPSSMVQGEVELAGRLTIRSGDDCEGLCEGTGLAWLRLEGKELGGKLKFNPLVTGYPCWLAGNSKRFLFPAGDGQLYVQSLESDDSFEGETETPRRVEGWGSGLDGSERAIISDVVRPIVPRLGGRLLVAMNPPLIGGKQRHYGRSELWWMTLDSEATRIEAAGRLIEPSATDPEDRRDDERMPNAVCTSDGGIALAYLRRRAETNEWSLQLVPLKVDPKTGIPSVSASESRKVGADSAVTMPAFAPDGRTLYHIPRSLETGGLPTKIAVQDALGSIRGSRRDATASGR
jgi:hypothetical protein